MNEKNYYSIRMHASLNARHISGAERIVTPEKMNAIVDELITRARSKGCAPDQIKLTIDYIGATPLRSLTALNVFSLSIDELNAAKSIALHVLCHVGISKLAEKRAMDYLAKGAAPGNENMRGAMIVDAETGERLEIDPARGIRASRLDWTDEAGKCIRKQLSDIGLLHFRTYEALALATKVTHAPGVIAELCWSDDPDYTAGYVASIRSGYVRLPFLKQQGDPKGGRAIFVNKNTVNMSELVNYLQKEAILIDKTGSCKVETCMESYLRTLS